MNPEPDVSEEYFEQTIASFEQSWQGDQVPQIEAFVQIDSPANRELLVELIRIELEFKFKRQAPVAVEEYLSRFAAVEFSNEEIAQLAFEEYRLAFRAGKDPQRDEYARRFDITTDHWPTWQSGSNGNDDPLTSTSANKQRRSMELPSVGETVHGFELVGQLGRGAFGAVFLARETELSDRLVAVKLTEPSGVEPQTLARLQHSNIIPIYSLKQDSQIQSICMPFLGVATLRDLCGQTDSDNSRMTSNGKALISTAVGKRASTIVDSVLPSQSQVVGSKLEEGKATLQEASSIDGFSYRQTVLWIYSQIADGIAYAHQHGVTHGDLKPENVLIGDDGRPLVLDFHLAKMEGRTEHGSQVGGTLPYMSGNHLRSLISQNSVTQGCDVFSLGVMMYESLTGRLPYPSDSAGDLIESMAKSRDQLPPSMRSHDRAISQDLDSIVMHCLRTDGGGYESAHQLHEDLLCQLNDLPLRFAANRSLVERSKKWLRRHPRLVSASTIGSLAVAVILLLSAWFVARSAGLTRAAAENRSRQFVEEMVDAQDELLQASFSNRELVARLEKIESLIEARASGDSSEYFTKLNELAVERQEQEKKEVAYTCYLLAYRRLMVAQSDPSAQKEAALEDAIEQLTFAESLNLGGLNFLILEMKSDVLAELGRTEAAEKLRVALRSTTPVLSGRELMLVAVEHFRKKEFQESLKVLNQLTREKPSWGPGWILKGRAYESLGQFDKAEVCFTTAISIEPEFPWGFIRRGIVGLKTKELVSAEDDLSRAIKLAPDLPETYLNRALCRTELGELDTALEDLDTAIGKEVYQTRAHYLRSELLRRLKRDAEADEAMKLFMELPPTDEISCLARGMAHVRSESPELALADFKRALKYNEFSVDAWQNIAAVESEMLQNMGAAIEAMNRIVELRGDDLVARVTRGVLLARNGQVDAARKEAISCVKESNGRKGDSADIYFRAAGVFALTSAKRKGDAEIAMGLLKKAAYKDARRVLQDIETDHDLDQLRQREDFIALLATLESLAGRKKN